MVARWRGADSARMKIRVHSTIPPGSESLQVQRLPVHALAVGVALPMDGYSHLND